jgi:hypothetical protein
MQWTQCRLCRVRGHQVCHQGPACVQSQLVAHHSRNLSPSPAVTARKSQQRFGRRQSDVVDLA